MTTRVRVLDFVGIAWTSLRVVGVQSPRGAGSSVTKVRASSHQMRRPTPPPSARRERTLGGGCGGGICTVTVRCVVRRNSAQRGLNRPRGEMSLPDAVCCLTGFTRQVRFGACLEDGQGDWVGNVEAYPLPVSAHVDDGDSVDPSRTVDTHLVAGAVAGDRGSQRRIQRDPLTGDVCLSWHNDGVLGVAEIIPHHDSRA